MRLEKSVLSENTRYDWIKPIGSSAAPLLAALVEVFVLVVNVPLVVKLEAYCLVRLKTGELIGFLHPTYQIILAKKSKTG
jgi:hypothetical protein